MGRFNGVYRMVMGSIAAQAVGLQGMVDNSSIAATMEGRVSMRERVQATLKGNVSGLLDAAKRRFSSNRVQLLGMTRQDQVRDVMRKRWGEAMG